MIWSSNGSLPTLPRETPVSGLNVDFAALEDVPATRSISLVLVGTFAIKNGQRLLNQSLLFGLDGDFTSVLAVDFDQRIRTQFRAELDPVYRSRTVVAQCSLPAGFANANHNAVEAKHPYWREELRAAASDLADLHVRRDRVGGHPTEIIVYVSPGATGAVAPELIRIVRQRFPNSLVVAFLVYPKHTRLRRQIKTLVGKLAEAGCRRILVADNVHDESFPERSYKYNDIGMNSLLTGILQANRTAWASTELNNAFALIWPEGGGLATLATHSERFPAYRKALLERRAFPYYVAESTAYSALVEGLRSIDENPMWAVSAELGHEFTSRADVLLTNIEPYSLSILEDRLEASCPGPSMDYLRFIASTREPMDPKDPWCTLTAVSVRALRFADKHIDAIIAPMPTATHALLPDDSSERHALTSSQGDPLPSETEAPAIITPPPDQPKEGDGLPGRSSAIRDRRHALLTLLDETDEFTIATAAEVLQSTEPTVRNDLAALGYAYDRTRKTWRRAR